MQELWKPIHLSEFCEYEVSSFGNMRRTRLIRKYGTSVTRLLKPWKNNNGYRYVTLTNGMRTIKARVSRLVAIAFLAVAVGKNVDHIDRNRANDNVGNLRWTTFSENNANRSVSRIRRCVHCGKPWRLEKNK